MAEEIVGSILAGNGKTQYLGDTGIKCPICNKAEMKIKTEMENTTTIECPNCLHIEHRPSESFGVTDIHGRPIKPPQKA